MKKCGALEVESALIIWNLKGISICSDPRDHRLVLLVLSAKGEQG